MEGSTRNVYTLFQRRVSHYSPSPSTPISLWMATIIMSKDQFDNAVNIMTTWLTDLQKRVESDGQHKDANDLLITVTKYVQLSSRLGPEIAAALGIFCSARVTGLYDNVMIPDNVDMEIVASLVIACSISKDTASSLAMAIGSVSDTSDTYTHGFSESSLPIANMPRVLASALTEMHKSATENQIQKMALEETSSGA